MEEGRSLVGSGAWPLKDDESDSEADHCEYGRKKKVGKPDQNGSKCEGQFYQRDILHKNARLKNYIEFVNCRHDQCEDRASETEDNEINYDNLLREALKMTRIQINKIIRQNNKIKMTREQEKFIQQLLDDAKRTNLRLGGVRVQHIRDKKICWQKS